MDKHSIWMKRPKEMLFTDRFFLVVVYHLQFRLPGTLFMTKRSLTRVLDISMFSFPIYTSNFLVCSTCRNSQTLFRKLLFNCHTLWQLFVTRLARYTSTGTNTTMNSMKDSLDIQYSCPHVAGVNSNKQLILIKVSPSEALSQQNLENVLQTQG